MQTNLTWIQNMSADELADFLFRFEKKEVNDVLGYCKERTECINNINEDSCRQCLKEWLNKERNTNR